MTAAIKLVTEIYAEFKEGTYCKIFDNDDFGYRRITVERPLKENGKIVKDKKGNVQSDSELRDYENVPLKEDVEKYFKKEVLPHLPDAWIDDNKTKKLVTRSISQNTFTSINPCAVWKK